MKETIDKSWLYKYYNSQGNDAHRMYEGGGFREYKQTRRLDIIKEMAASWDTTDKYVVDIGCGDGHAAAFLLQGKSFKYIGFDYSLYKLKITKQNVMAGDAENIPLRGESVDFVLCLETLEHLIRPGIAIREATRILRHDGICIVSVPINSYIQPFIRKIIRKIKGGSSFDEHIQTITVQPLFDMLTQSGLDILEVKFCGFNLPIINAVYKRMPYSFFKKIDEILSNIPLCYAGIGIHAGISFGAGNEYIIIATRKK